MFYVMDQRVYKDIRVFETVDELKPKVQKEWDSLSQRLINQTLAFPPTEGCRRGRWTY